jgi:energy-coupling factor transport system substrate-specific component
VVDFDSRKGLVQHVGLRGKATVEPLDREREKRPLARDPGGDESFWITDSAKALAIPRRWPRKLSLASRVALTAAATALGAAAWAALDPDRGGLAVLLAGVAVLVTGAAALESGTESVKDLALVATVAGVAAAGRVLFVAIPGVQPVTVIVVVAGASLGARRGFAVGAVAALASNFFLGQGVWTPWQMLAWGACGLAGAAAAPLLRRRFALAALTFALGLAFSAFLDVWEWYAFFPHTWAAFTLQMSRGFPFELAHAIGNVLISLAVGPELRRVLERYERRTRVDIAWA